MTTLYRFSSVLLFISMVIPLGLLGQSESNGRSLFDKYEWLQGQFADCDDGSILEYDLGPFSYVYGSDGRLFFQDGTFYCQDTETRDCRQLYNLSDVTDESNCAGNSVSKIFTINSTSSQPAKLGDIICFDLVLPQLNNVEYFQIPIAYDIESLSYLPDECMSTSAVEGFVCQNISDFANRGNLNILWFHPDGNSSDIPAGDILASVCFQLLDDSKPQTSVSIVNSNSGFDFEFGTEVDENTTSVMNVFQFNNASIQIDQPEETEEGTNTGLPIGEFPWMDDIANNLDCNNLSLTEYDQGAFSFFLFEDNTNTQVYFEDGTFYCQDREGLDCKSTYNLLDDQIVNQWSCEARSSETNFITGRVLDSSANPLQDVSVQINFPETGAYVVRGTQADGSYSFELDANDNSTKVISIGGIDRGNSCMNVFDVVVTRAYILGIFFDGRSLGTLPASIFAMNFNETSQDPNRVSGFLENVSTLDLVLMTKILLGITDDSNLWRFYESESVMESNGEYEVNREVEFVNADDGPINFIAYQLGDVNNCAGYDFSLDSTLYMQASANTIQEGKNCYDIATTTTIENINALEFSLNYNPMYWNSYSIHDAKLNRLDINSTHYDDEKNQLNIVWMNDNILEGTTIEADQSFITICLEPNAAESFSDNINVVDAGFVNTNFEYGGLAGGSIAVSSGNDSSADLTDLFDTYPWMNSIINCNSNEMVEEYESGIFKFLYIKPAGSLYFQNGTFYCQDTETQDCRSLYDLTTISNDWSCDLDNFTNPSFSDAVTSYQNLTLYPNPVSDFVHIQNKEAVIDIYVVDSSGKTMYSKTNINSNFQTVDFQQFESGIYFVKLRTESEIIVNSVVKL